ncbi:MAG: UDP-N-acetylmuramate--L-alanine ligase, partial [Candidatus Omnitrophica bacterium]|nr:UDP-N-acetylmuramate--L-alanine ligase [Candidatus Omnitrophota bacterium]
NASLGNGKFFVAEADESDGSFLCYQPKYSIITNIDYEHIDYYSDFKNVVNAFKEFLNKTQEDGCAFCCNDDINIKNILKDYKKSYLSFGLKKNADVYPRNIKMNGLSSEFDCFYKDKLVDRFHLALGGEHNISNALSVIALGLKLDIKLGMIKKVLSGYKGVARRLEIKFRDERYLVIDDYAHHPTEIRAALEAVKNLKVKRIIVVFQPHRFTRTKLLLDEFAKSFDLADYLVVTDIYAASELPLEGISGSSMCDKIKEYNPNKKLRFLPKEEITGHILEIIKPQDLVITLGAGDIGRTSDELVERLKRQDQVK